MKNLLLTVLLFCGIATFSNCRSLSQKKENQPAITAITPLPALDTQVRLEIRLPLMNVIYTDTARLRKFADAFLELPFGVQDISGAMSSHLVVSGNDSLLKIQPIRPGTGVINLYNKDSSAIYRVRVITDTPKYWIHAITALATHDPFVIRNDSIAPAFSQAMFINRPLPEKGLKDLKGQSVTARRLQGKISVLTFWYYGCGACERLREPMNLLAAQWQGPEVAFYAVCKDSGYVKNNKPVFQAIRTQRNSGHRDTVFMPEHWEGTNLVCGERLSQSLYGYGYPTILVLDAQGVIRYSFGGYYDGIARDVDAAIRFLWQTKEVYISDLI